MIYYCGDVGVGQIMKFGNNVILLGIWVLILEVWEVVKVYGMDFDCFMEVFNVFMGCSLVLEVFLMLFQCVFWLLMLIKDLLCCFDVGCDFGVLIFFVQVSFDVGILEIEDGVQREFLNDLFGLIDFSEIYFIE